MLTDFLAVYWYMGALTNSGRRTANYIGLYKGIQSAGSAVMWSIDSHKTSFMGEFISNWVLLGASLLIALPVVFSRITDHSSIDGDLVDTGETVADIIPDHLGEKNVSHDESVH